MSRKDNELRTRLCLAALLLCVSLPTSILAEVVAPHDDFDRLLRTYVRDPGVDYASWHAHEADRAALETYLEILQSLDPSTLERNDRLAFWLNLYNATTLDLILDHYVDAKGRTLASIKDLGGLLSSPWEKELVTVRGRALSLNAIENEIIRPEFEEPRIHFALNCAAVSCPPLSPFAYDGGHLEEQLETATVRTITDLAWVDLRACGAYSSGKLRLTKIFDWYGDDFGGKDGTRKFLERYLPRASFALRNDGCDVDYLPYDWSLNRARTVGSGP